MTVDLILLVLNEIDGLRAVLPQVPREFFNRVMAVDGGSTDGSVEFLQEQGVEVVNQSRRGRGQAFSLGVAASTAEAFVFFSPDGNEDPADLPKMVAFLRDGADLVIASRMCAGAVNEEDSQLLKPRRWVNNAFNLALNALFNPRPRAAFVTDSINGYRGLRRSALPAVEPFPDDYTVEYRMTARALQAGLRVVEFATHERDRVGGETKVPSLQAGLRFIRALGEESGAMIASRMGRRSGRRG
ncbi:MAG: glycosyltransferase family 2 protein [Deltaproteobacteria bacterium]|nr:glycosyltransferase family 2 protein [Deltaproteobacteria bacterium]